MSGAKSVSDTAKSLGKIGSPLSVKEIAAQKWDAIVVGGGHNGLSCAAYLAKAGKRVVVLEKRERIGGACTLEEPWPGIRMSPCAYVVGLLHPLILKELNFRGHGFDWSPAVGGMFVPFLDGTSIQMWNDDDKCAEEVKRFAPEDFKGWQAMGAVKQRLRDKLRPEGDGDIWIGRSPSREQIEERLKGDEEARKLLFEWSMVEYTEHFLTNEKLQAAYMGQGVIGTNASPFEKGTASINYHHVSGRMEGLAGTWGYVKGGMGMVSFHLTDIAKEAGAVVAAGVGVARIIPGEGVELEGGERVYAPNVISNADPRVTLKLLGQNVDAGWKAHVESVPIQGCTMKINLALRELPNFKARPGVNEPHHLGQVNTPLTKPQWQANFDAAKAGKLPERFWTEIYFHTAFDKSVAPPGVHTMSVFAQFVPHTFAEGNWDSRREEAKQLAYKTIGEFCSNFPGAVIDADVMGPPDIETKTGLTGGHIFQGEMLPQYMWDKRLTAHTPMPGVFLCGSGTYPGGSVMGINGRNAAMEVLGRVK